MSEVISFDDLEIGDNMYRVNISTCIVDVLPIVNIYSLDSESVHIVHIDDGYNVCKIFNKRSHKWGLHTNDVLYFSDIIHVQEYLNNAIQSSLIILENAKTFLDYDIQ